MTTLASVNNVSLALGGDTLFVGLSLQVHQGDHIGLVGPNGSGKSSLFRLLAGKIEPDGGVVKTLPGVRVGFLPQEITSFPNEQVLTFVYDSVPGRPELRAELERNEARLAELEHDNHANEDELVAVASSVAELHEKIALLDGQFSEHDAKKILHGLGFTQDDHRRLLSELSGGWKMRAVLASLLVSKTRAAAPRRADQPPGHAVGGMVLEVSEQLRPGALSRLPR